MLEDKDLRSIQQARSLLAKAAVAIEELKSFDQAQTDRIVGAMAEAARENAARLAEMAVEETGYGNVRDKTRKNLFSAVDVFRYIRELKTCGVISENQAKKVIDIAVPAGVIAAVIPTTNPTSTAIFKILSALKGRNAIVLSPHPNALRCTVETARVMREAAIRAGAPQDCVGWMDEVTLEGTTELMRNKLTNLILATGGSGLVRAAYSSGKPAFGVGPGNVPAYIESSADVTKAVADIIAGKTFDFGVLCSSEQALICDRAIEAQVLRELQKNHAFIVEGEELRKLEQVIQLSSGQFNTKIVGQAAPVIAEMAGIRVPEGTVCLAGRAEGVGPEHPLSREKLSPILALYIVDDWQEGCRRCIEILSYGGLGHTMAIHSSNREIILEFGLHKPAYRVCVNTPATLGAIGLTTGVPPSMTLGCGTPGGNITSDNITPLHLINVRRVAFETRPIAQDRAMEADGGREDPPGPDDRLRHAVREVVDRYLGARNSRNPANQGASEASAPPPAPAPSPEVPPPVSVEPTERTAPLGPPVDFVCEEDVRRAIRFGQKIAISERTLLTPSAREFAEGKGVLVFSD